MQSSLWIILGIVAFSGAIGGVVNAFMTDNGFLLPKSDSTSTGTTILRPGYLGNVLIGAVAAILSWGLYGPLSTFFITGTTQAMAANTAPENVGLSISSLVGAILVGIGGARWLSAEVDKTLLRAAAAEAAGKPASNAAVTEMAVGTPSRALDTAKNMRPG